MKSKTFSYHQTRRSPEKGDLVLLHKDPFNTGLVFQVNETFITILEVRVTIDTFTHDLKTHHRFFDVPNPNANLEFFAEKDGTPKKAFG